MNNQATIKLTQYSHGAGCGCKISPAVLDNILAAAGKSPDTYPSLLVGNEDRDDAAVMDLGDGTAVISTTDFFMPIVDDPETFGRIAATNAISDIYAMGGTPLMAIAILGWPISMLSPEVAGMVVRGAQRTCREAGIPLAGGHSIDAPEPIFGLAVTGRVSVNSLKRNGGAKKGDLLFLTKPLGVGILTTAQKLEKLKPEDEQKVIVVMTRLNSVGERLAKFDGVHAMTDITGFGLAGHLFEMCKASKTSASIHFNQIPLITPGIADYIAEGCVPRGANRNYESYGGSLNIPDLHQQYILCDPQTSGGLLVSVHPDAADQVITLLEHDGLYTKPIGEMEEAGDYVIYAQ